ncbi:MAG: hypothetical protein FWG34_03880 [Oscillospiraceae bacterium]|nr:hypothetical protein [Oscillospiraceae bacterium]
MAFDKNQNAFPSDLHREVWWWAVGIVPPSESLTDTVKSRCNRDVLEGCYQWHKYFGELCEDMYNEMDVYAPLSARQYRDMLENIAAGGELFGDKIVFDGCSWEKYAEKLDKSKAYANSGATLEKCLGALGRTGLRIERANEKIAFHNEKHPKIFHAMSAFERSPNIRKTPARHHFAHCEFRQLFKSYSASYDGLLRRVSDESLEIAHAIHGYAKSLKIQRYIHFDTIKYKHKNIRVLDFSVSGGEYPTLRANIGTCANPGAGNMADDEFYTRLLAADLDTQALFIKNLERCSGEGHNHLTLRINGKNEQICPNSKIRINPFIGDLEAVLYFIAARKASIDQYR